MHGQRVNPEILVALQATGDSMEPHISHGDTLLLDLGQTEVLDGRVYAIRCGDELQLRVMRLYKRYDGGLLIRSDNREMYPEEIDPPEAKTHIAISERVVWVGGRFEGRPGPKRNPALFPNPSAY